MEERFLIGAIAGAITGILKDIPDAIFHYGLKITKITFWDYAGVIALGHHPNGLFEHVYALIFEVNFSIFLGAVFVYITTCFRAKQLLIWGGFYGAIIWFAIRVGVVGLGIKPLVDGEIGTAFINSLGSIIYGIMLAYLIQYLENKEPV